MFIGIDVGGTNIKYGLMDHDNNVVFHDSRETGSGVEGIIDNLADITLMLKDLSKNKFHSDVVGVGIGVPGIINRELNHVFRCPNIGWSNVPLSQLLKEKTGFYPVIDNDANLAALAEYYIGSLQGVQTGVLLTLGTGVGGGVVINGKPYRGGNGLGMEIGHTVIGKNFYNCNCGKNGCFETFSSATAIVKYMEKLITDHSVTTDYEITSKEIFTQAQGGDRFASEAVAWFVEYLAIGIVNIINTLDPEIISLGGGVAQAGDFLMDAVREEVGKNLLVKGFPSASIQYASAGNRAGIIGAALLAKTNGA